MGSLGSKYKDKLFPVIEVSVKDVSGAGDTFLSGLVSEYIKTNNIDKSIKFANKCATIVVQQRGVAAV
jgi:sugar/nucleoside kinase (ribokinase family)